jgi:hypothetical protein
MTDMQKLVDVMSAACRSTRADYHLTLGRAIEYLEGVDERYHDLPVKFEWDASPLAPHSYRGYYSDLAFEWTPSVVTAAEFRKLLRQSLGRTFTGYKGGEFTMDEDTPLWTAQYGCTGRAIIGVGMEGNNFVLRTKDIL